MQQKKTLWKKLLTVGLVSTLSAFVIGSLQAIDIGSCYCPAPTDARIIDNTCWGTGLGGSCANVPYSCKWVVTSAAEGSLNNSAEHVGYLDSKSMYPVELAVYSSCANYWGPKKP